MIVYNNEVKYEYLFSVGERIIRGWRRATERIVSFNLWLLVRNCLMGRLSLYALE